MCPLAFCRVWLVEYVSRVGVCPLYDPVQSFFKIFAPIAHRKNLSGILDTPRLVLWNIEKK